MSDDFTVTGDELDRCLDRAERAERALAAVREEARQHKDAYLAMREENGILRNRLVRAASAPPRDIRKTRELVNLVLERKAYHEDTVAFVLLVLDSHHLLRDFPGTAAEYHARVQRAYADALRAITKEQ